jgi:hypothetical protein
MSGFEGPQMHERACVVGIRELLRKPLQRKDSAECFGRFLPRSASHCKVLMRAREIRHVNMLRKLASDYRPV